MYSSPSLTAAAASGPTYLLHVVVGLTLDQFFLLKRHTASHERLDVPGRVSRHLEILTFSASYPRYQPCACPLMAGEPLETDLAQFLALNFTLRRVP
jgi:hypothetical protein